MADESFNPESAAQQRRLLRELQKAAGELNAAAQRAEKREKTAGADTGSARREASTRGRRATGETRAAKEEIRAGQEEEKSSSERAKAARARTERARTDARRARLQASRELGERAGILEPRGSRALVPSSRYAQPAGAAEGIARSGARIRSALALTEQAEHAKAAANVQEASDQRRRTTAANQAHAEMTQRQKALFQKDANDRAIGRAAGIGAGYGTEPLKRPLQGRVADLAAGTSDTEEFTRARRDAAQAEARLGTQLQQTTTTQGLASSQMRRHGALTTEFISAASKGEVTLRELGFQVGSTIGKFAGWTLAAASVYGALAAVKSLGDGALDSLAGVHQLERVVNNLDTGRAQQQFRDLSSQFNLPIADVAEAAYGASKIFRDQGDIFTATQAALYAVKIGELDAGTATRALTSIVGGFKLEAKDLPGVFDQINQAQNKFGGNSGQLVLGLAKAGGAFRAAGGDVSYLLALIQAGTRLTGRTGEELGTAIQRSAEIITRPNRRQDITALLGVDPKDSSIKDVYEAAFEEAKGASKERVNEIARTISTPQLANRIVPILQNRALFSRILDETSPEKSKDSGAKELAKALKSPREQVARLANEMQRLGSALAESGALTSLGGLLRLLNLSLGTATKIVEAFDRLPDGATTALTTFAQLALVLKGLRRFNVGDNFGQGATSQFFTQSPEKRAARLIPRGLNDQSDFLNAERERSSIQASLATNAARSQAKRIQQLDPSVGVDVLKQEEERLKHLEKTAAGHIADEADMRNEINRVQVQRAGFLRDVDRSGKNALEVAQKHGIDYYPGTFDRGALAPEGARSVADDLATGGPGGTGAAGQAKRAEQKAARAANRLSTTGSILASSERGTMRAVGKGLDKLGTGVAVAGAGAERIAESAKGATSTMKEAIGGFQGALLGITAAYIIGQSLAEHFDEQGKAADKLGRGPTSARASRDKARRGDAFKGTVFENESDVAEAAIRRQRQAAIDASRASGSNYAVAGQYLGEIKGQVKRDLEIAGSPAEKAAILRRAISEARSSDQYSQGGDAKAAAVDAINAYKSQLNDLKVATGAIKDIFKGAESAKDFQGIADRNEANIALGGGRVTNRQIDVAGRAKVLLRRLHAAGKLSAKDTAAQIGGFDQQIGPALDKELQDRLVFARSAEDRAKVFASVTARARRFATRTDAAIARLRARVNGGNDKAIAAARAKVRGDEKLTDAPSFTGGLGGRVDFDQHDLDRRGAEKKLTKDNRALAKLRAGDRQDAKELKELVQQRKNDREALKLINRKRFEAEEQVREARGQAQVAAIRDPLAAAGKQLELSNAALARAAKEYGRGSAEFYQKLGGVAEAQKAVQQAQQTRLQNQQSVDTARAKLGGATDSDIQKLAVRQAQAMLALAVQSGDPDAILTATATLLDAKTQVKEAIEADLGDLISALGELAESKTDDPNKQARIKLQTAIKLRKKAPGKTRPDRIRQDAEINNLRREAQHTKEQEFVDDLAFQRDIGQITQEAYVRSIQQFLANHKNLAKTNRELYRTLKRELAQASKDVENDRQGFALNVSDIRLPTVYDVRRGIKAAAGGTNSNFTSSPNITVEVNDPGAAGAVFSAIENATGADVRAAARAAGVL